jgi:hypothetical protein
MAVHGGEAVAHAGPAGPAVLQAEDVAELVAGDLAPGGGVGQVAVLRCRLPYQAVLVLGS